MAGLFKSGAMGDPDIVKTLAELVWKMWNEFLKKRIFEVNPRILLNFMLNSCWILSFCGLGLGSIFKLWNVLGGYLYLGPAPTKIWYPFIILCWTYVPAGTLLRLPEISRTCWVRPRRCESEWWSGGSDGLMELESPWVLMYPPWNGHNTWQDGITKGNDPVPKHPFF